MSASAFIRLLESRGLLDPEIISELDRQVETSKVRVTPEAIAKLLVDNGQLTRFQATNLISDLNKSIERPANDPTAALRGGRPIDEPPTSDSDSVEDLLPDDIVEDVEEVVPVEVEEDAQPVIQVVAQPVAARDSRRGDDDLETVVRPVTKTTKPKKNAWDSFRIVGIAFLLVLFLMPAAFLVYWVSQGSADEAYELAETTYNARDYEQASKRFLDFSGKYYTDPRSSKAKVLGSLALVREESEKAADPMVALKKAQETLPTVAAESGIAEVRSDIADTLLKMSEKFVNRLDSAKSLEDREKLLVGLNEQFKLINDPRYIGSEERTQNKLRIQKIEEGKSRAEQDIVRGKDLVTTIAAMEKSNSEQDISKTYDLRKTLLLKHPRLEGDAKLRELLDQATKLQKDRVTNVSPVPSISDVDREVDVVAKAVLVNTNGQGDSSNQNILALRIKNSVVAIREGNGQLLWRRFLGLAWEGDVFKFSPTGDSDILVSLPEQKKFMRLAANDGKLIWEATFSDRVNPPKIDGDEVIITTRGGDIYALDSTTGQTRWRRRVPQPVDIGAGGGSQKPRYVIGNHSNLYALNRAGGDCQEVLYLGHSAGTIAIPPIWLLNHLIVFENTGPDYSYLRIFRTNDSGTEITPSQQLPLQFRGHFVVEPQVSGSRIVVTTNLGEVAVLEIVATNPRDTVVRLAGSIEKENEPKVLWPLLAGTNLYLASNRLALYQIQVSSQKLNRSWQKHDGDQFVSRPIRGEDAIYHARVVRGNLGVRVSSINTQSGEMNWEVDLGVPVTTLVGDTSGFTAVTSQGAVYSFDPKAFQSKTPVKQLENQGRNQTEMKFTLPIQIKDGRTVVLNTMKGNEVLLVDGSKKRSISRSVVFDFGSASPSNEPVAVGDFLAVPLSNAQLALIDPSSAKIVGVPFQPTVQADEIPQWLNPVLLSDNQSIVIADQKRNMYKLSTTGKQLKPIVQQPLERGLKGRLSLLNDVIVGVSATDTGDQFDFFDSVDLRKTQSLSVEGRFAWGPFTVKGDTTSIVIAHSDIEGLIAVNEVGKRLWTTPIDREAFVAKPTAIEDDCLIGTAGGDLIRVSLATGEIVARKRLGEPINMAPILFPKVVIVPTEEGSILTIPTPTRGQ